jgi:uncharacterized RDD family membrane protein YckC
VSQEPWAAPIERGSAAPHQVVHSPEQYRLELPLAGPTSRILAYAIDYAAIALLEILAFVALVATVPVMAQLQSLFDEFRGALESGDPNAVAESSFLLVVLGLALVIQLLIEWGYFIFWEMTTGGRSPGKAAVKLRVVGDGGHPLRLGQSVARNLLRAVDILPGYYAVGLIAMIASDEGKRLGDLAAGTVVVRLDRPAPAPDVSSVPPTGAGTFRFSHAQVERVGPDEQRLVRQTLRRLPDLTPAQADVALERTADVIVRRIGHEPVAAPAREDFLRALLHTVERR